MNIDGDDGQARATSGNDSDSATVDSAVTEGRDRGSQRRWNPEDGEYRPSRHRATFQ